MSKKILVGLMTLVLAVGLVGAGAFAQFFDTETSTGNTFTAGTLDLKVDGEDDGGTVAHYTLSDMKPGDSVTYQWTLKNVGTLSGKVSVTFSPIINNDNGLTEPEQKAGDTTGGDGQGELGAYLQAKPFLQYYTSERPLNAFSGYMLIQHPLLGQNDEVVFSLKLSLPSDVGNIVQSDSAAFDIIFQLDQ